MNSLLSILLDLRASIHKINYNIVLHEQEHVTGIKWTAPGWFTSYLSDSFQFVHVNDEAYRLTCIQKLVMGFHMALCLDHFFLLYTFPP